MNTDNEMNFHQLLLKAERYCAYQERCSYEVRHKMKESGADKQETEKIILSLQENDFLNDCRFASLFASGKFRIKKWGKNKIRAELKMKKIADELITKGIDTIDAQEYVNTIDHLIRRKEKELKGQTAEDRRQKIMRFLLSKGFESDLIWKHITSKISK